MDKEGVQAVVIQTFFDPDRAILIDLATKYQLPYMSGSRDVTAAGGLVSTRSARRADTANYPFAPRGSGARGHAAALICLL
jgi:hypothetical protein